MDGVHGIADDIVTHDTTENEQDGRVLALCKTAKMNNLSLNPEKMQFKSRDCKFFRHRIITNGIGVDPKKIGAITKVKAPDSLQTLQSFMGMVNYLKKFTPVLTELYEPLRRLVRSGVEWVWEPAQQTAFEAIIKVITNLPVLEYFDSTMDYVIQTEASKRAKVQYCY